MNKSINKILREVEDSSDDFFQSKHVNKRKEDLKKELEKNKKEIERTKKTIIPKLIKGIEKIKEAYMSKDWKDDKEKLFLELFSKLRVDDKVYESVINNKYRYGCYLLSKHNLIMCAYDIRYGNFWIDFGIIWMKFHEFLRMNAVEIQYFMKQMLKKYLDIDVTAITRRTNISIFNRYEI